MLTSPPVQGQLYDLKGRGTNPGPAFSPVTAVPGTAEGGGGGVARVSVEGEGETDRMVDDVKINTVESDPQNTYLQVRR